MLTADPERVLFALPDGDVRPFARLAATPRMRSVIELLIWSVAAIVVFSGVAFLGAKLIPPYVIHE